MKRSVIFTFVFLLTHLSVFSQMERFGENLDYKVAIGGAASTGGDAPFWFTAGRYGASSAKQYSGSLRASIIRSIENDSLCRWRMGYGADVMGAIAHATPFQVQQLFFELQYEGARLSLGAKERPMEMLNPELSTGGMTFSNNAVPIPQIRFELPRWWNISGKARLVFIKGHIAYGMLTDDWWQEKHNGGHTNQLYSRYSWYHSKAGYLKVGNRDKFPLEFTLGLEMAAQFGGTIFNLYNRGGATGLEDVNYGAGSVNRLSNSPADFFHAFIPGGSDANDGDYSNVGGNQLGSWRVSLGWHDKTWSVRAYLDHFFEDHSMMFWQYPWIDNLVGIEAEFPKNPVVSGAVVEYLHTMNQSGPIYHDITEDLPIGLYGKDNYYSHHVYGGYQHWGQNLGNPLLLSPIYNTNGSLGSRYSRLQAFHVGLSGDPHPDVHWRALYTNMRTLGTYDAPTPTPRFGHYYLVEADYKPHQIPGWGFRLSIGGNGGTTLRQSHGAMLTISKLGVIRKRRNR